MKNIFRTLLIPLVTLSLGLSSCSNQNQDTDVGKAKDPDGKVVTKMPAAKGEDFEVNKVYTVNSVDGITDGVDFDKGVYDALKTFAFNLQDIDNYGMAFEFIFEFTNYVPLMDFTAKVEIETNNGKHLSSSSMINGYIDLGTHYLAVSVTYEYRFVLQNGVPEIARFSYEANKAV